MRRIRLGGQGVSMWTPAPRRAETTPPKRKEIAGWTKGAAQRNRAFLMSVDPTLLSRDLGYAVTLTIGETPSSAAIWAKMIHHLLVTLGRLGVIRYHWITEWTKKGRPHLHLTFFLQGCEPVIPYSGFFPSFPSKDYFGFMKARAAGDWWFASDGEQLVRTKVIGPYLRQKRVARGCSHSLWFTDMIVANAIYVAWKHIVAPLPFSDRAMHIERIEALSGWSAYVAKHCARGIDHYQRTASVLPEGWTSSGRLWGKGGDWPVRSDNLELDDTSYFRLRRVVRKWLLAKTRFNAAQAFGRKQDMARNDLKYLRKQGKRLLGANGTRQDPKNMSSVLGLSSFVPRDLIDVLLVWAIDHAEAVLIDVSTGEVHTRNDASDAAILAYEGG
jgi:hypothetical protein